jgi:hypothetical protein
VYSIYIAALDLAGNPPSLTVLELKTPDSAAPRYCPPKVVCDISCFQFEGLQLLIQPEDAAFLIR